MARKLVSIAMFTMVAGMSLLMRDLAAQPDVKSQLRQQVPAQVPIARSMQFNIPSQSLQTALDAYGEQTGFAGLYSAADVQNLTSSAVSGLYTTDAALRLLLEGSGLQAHYTAADAFVLEPLPAATPSIANNIAYDALLQAGVRAAFCREPLIAALDYRIALRFYVNKNGRIIQAALLDSSGNKARDAAILQALSRVDLRHGPANPALPFFMLILPQQLAGSADCHALAGRP